jgi:hypothetical protein
VTLRDAVFIIGLLLLAGGVVAVFAGAGLPAIGPIIAGSVVVLGTVFEHRGRTDDERPGPGWERTGERFREPDGKVVDVWFNQATGERRYVKR